MEAEKDKQVPVLPHAQQTAKTLPCPAASRALQARSRWLVNPPWAASGEQCGEGAHLSLGTVMSGDLWQGLWLGPRLRGVGGLGWSTWAACGVGQLQQGICFRPLQAGCH